MISHYIFKHVKVYHHNNVYYRMSSYQSISGCYQCECGNWNFLSDFATSSPDVHGGDSGNKQENGYCI